MSRQISRAGVFPVFLAFLAMGFADAAGPFVGLAREQFNLSYFLSQLIPFTGFLMFGLLSIPFGVYQDKKGKKFILVLGLLLMLAGLLIPSLTGFSTFAMFLVTVLLLGAGAAAMQVAGNPLMRDVSEEGKYARNLSLGQFVKAIGSLSGPLIPVLAARYWGTDWRVVFPIYSAAIVVTLLAVAPLKDGGRRSPEGRPATFTSSLALLRIPYVAMMIGALFLYVGAEVSISAGIPLYLKDRFGVDINRIGLLGTGLFFLSLTIGRFSGGVILNWMTPSNFFVLTSSVSIAGLLGLFAASQTLVSIAFFAVGIGFANIFPLIFSLVIERMPHQANALSGLMVMAIAGGAILPPVMGFVADITQSVEASFLVPLAALVYIMWAALKSKSLTQSPVKWQEAH
jgi:FHS family L-fucose permease-like MFS transporter